MFSISYQACESCVWELLWKESRQLSWLSLGVGYLRYLSSWEDRHTTVGKRTQAVYLMVWQSGCSLPRWNIPSDCDIAHQQPRQSYFYLILSMENMASSDVVEMRHLAIHSG